jgi:hypothetical protein
MGNNLLETARARAAQSSAVLTTDPTVAKVAPSNKEPTAPISGTDSTTETKVAGIIETVEEVKYVPYVPVEGDYKALRLNQFYVADGKRIAPNSDGWYHPADEEQKELLEYYATKHGLVEAFQSISE